MRTRLFELHLKTNLFFGIAFILDQQPEAAYVLPDLLLGRPRVRTQQRNRGDQHARRAESALHPALLEEGGLQRMKGIVCGEPLDGADFAPTDGDVDFFDFARFAEQWLWCNDPEDLSCTPNW